MTIGAKIIGHDQCVMFQLAEVAVPRGLFNEILRLIAQLQAPLAQALKRSLMPMPQ